MVTGSFGFHVNAKAMALTIEKAKTANVAACTVFRQSHVGRLAAYPMMAGGGMIGLATADSGRFRRSTSRRSEDESRGSAPIQFRSRCPRTLEGPFCLDMATSAVAAGTIPLAVARSEQIRKGDIIDAAGRHKLARGPS